MVNLEEILLNLVKPLVSDQDSVSVIEMPSLDDKEILLFVYANPNDISRLIGRKGTMANALRTMLLVSSKSVHKRISIKFEAF